MANPTTICTHVGGQHKHAMYSLVHNWTNKKCSASHTHTQHYPHPWTVDPPVLDNGSFERHFRVRTSSFHKYRHLLHQKDWRSRIHMVYIRIAMLRCARSFHTHTHRTHKQSPVSWSPFNISIHPFRTWNPMQSGFIQKKKTSSWNVCTQQRIYIPEKDITYIKFIANGYISNKG